MLDRDRCPSRCTAGHPRTRWCSWSGRSAGSTGTGTTPTSPASPAIMNGRLISANTAPVPAGEGAARPATARPAVDAWPRRAASRRRPATGDRQREHHRVELERRPDAQRDRGATSGPCRPRPSRGAAPAPQQHPEGDHGGAHREQVPVVERVEHQRRRRARTTRTRNPASQASIAADSNPAIGQQHRRADRKSPSVDDGSAASQIAIPVSTGYSSAPPYSCSRPGCSRRARRERRARSMSRPIHRYWMSE